MKCPHCKSKWTAATTVLNCPFCKKALAATVPAQITMESVLIRIRDQIGLEAMNNGKLLIGAFSDLAPSLNKEKQILKYFSECNGPTLIYQARSKTEPEQRRLMQQLIQKMTRELMISEGVSQKICEIYVFVVTGRRINLTAPSESIRPAVQNRPVPVAAVGSIPKPISRNYPGFEIDSNGVLIRYTGNEKNVTIPPHIVTIGEDAFSYNNNIQQVYFPDGLKEIKKEAFAQCCNLQSVTFPSSLKNIGYQAFWGCQSFHQLTLPGQLQHIEPYAFFGCINLNTVILQHGIQSLDCCLFNTCHKLQHVYVPDSLRYMHPHTFSGRQTIYIHCSPSWQKDYGHLLSQSLYAKLIPIVKDDIREMPTLRQRMDKHQDDHHLSVLRENDFYRKK